MLRVCRNKRDLSTGWVGLFSVISVDLRRRGEGLVSVKKTALEQLLLITVV